MSIKRYYICDYLPNGDATPPITVERDDGWLCLYADHAAVLAAKDAEIAALRERCERLVKEVRAWRNHDAVFTMIVGVSEVNRLLSFDTFYRTSGDVCEAMQLVKDHNDLQPPAGKESSDG